MNQETKADRRAKKREKQKQAPIGVPASKIRATTEVEIRAKLRKIKKKLFNNLDG